MYSLTPTLYWTALGLLTLVTGSKGQNFEWFSTDPDIFRNSTQILASRGFQSEIHHPVTKDGYILTLVRVINPWIRKNGNQMRPIYFQHGLFGNGDDFLLTQHEALVQGQFITQNGQATNCTGSMPENVGISLPMVLATCGYDVWIGNYRGSRYSTGHIILNQRDPEYWAFTVDQYSLYDVPANIEYILSETGHAQLGYVGHSLGTSVMFQLLSARPDYSRYIKPYIALAPVAHVSHIKAPIFLAAAYNSFYIGALSTMKTPFFGITSDQLTKLDQIIAQFICGNTFLKPLCVLFLFSLCGIDFPNTPLNVIPFAAGHFPDNTASQVLAHLAQRVTRNTFSFYDYGLENNLKLYNSPVPPVYNLSHINLETMILISGINDWLADPTDVDILRSQLTVPIYRDYVVPFDLYNHDDFLIGINAGKVQNSRILQWLQELYSNSV